ncbi:MAG: riboflavin biosynthesis protein RibF [candidate division WOR-3 bacterium]
MTRAEPRRGLVVAVGSFDGVHLGHQQIINRAHELARSAAGVTAVLTFSPLAAQLVDSDFTFVLTPLPERVRLLACYGVSIIHVLRFDEALRNSTAADFVRRHLVEPLQPAAVVVGHDHRFGRNGEGNVATLHELLAPAGIWLEVVDEFQTLGAPVRSTRVREHLLLGHVQLAARLLGRPYAVAGPVVTGTGIGRRLGFPTLNIHVPEREKLVPADGVYAAMIELHTTGQVSEPLPAAVNIGHRPTFGGERRTIEAHIISGQIPLSPDFALLHFVDRIRPELAFESAEQLAAQIRTDIEAVRLRLESAAAVLPACIFRRSV